MGGREDEERRTYEVEHEVDRLRVEEGGRKERKSQRRVVVREVERGRERKKDSWTDRLLSGVRGRRRRRARLVSTRRWERVRRRGGDHLRGKEEGRE